MLDSDNTQTFYQLTSVYVTRVREPTAHIYIHSAVLNDINFSK